MLPTAKKFHPTPTATKHALKLHSASSPILPNCTAPPATTQPPSSSGKGPKRSAQYPEATPGKNMATR